MTCCYSHLIWLSYKILPAVNLLISDELSLYSMPLITTCDPSCCMGMNSMTPGISIDTGVIGKYFEIRVCMEVR
jgi:hypothetical protein